MGTLVVDLEFGKKLQTLDESVRLVDGSGKVLGRFVPSPDPEEYCDLEPRISDEEIRQRLKDKGKTFTTAEVLAHLESL